jgi:hypothetical protein
MTLVPTHDSDDDGDHDRASGAAESETSSDSICSDSEADKKSKAKKGRRAFTSRDANADGSSDVKLVSHSMQRLVILPVSSACMFVIIACVSTLCYVCIDVIKRAEGAGARGEINNSCRRSFSLSVWHTPHSSLSMQGRRLRSKAKISLTAGSRGFAQPTSFDASSKDLSWPCWSGQVRSGLT